MKHTEVCIKTTSTFASFSVEDQVIKHTTAPVKRIVGRYC